MTYSSEYLSWIETPGSLVLRYTETSATRERKDLAVTNTSLLTSVNPRNQACLALIAAHATAWQFNENGHQELRARISKLVDPGLYHRVEPTLQPVLVEVFGSIWEPGAGKDAFKVGYFDLTDPKTMVVESVADFLAKFQPESASEPMVPVHRPALEAPNTSVAVVH